MEKLHIRVERLEKEKAALIERLNACYSAIDSATETMLEILPNAKQTDFYLELCGEIVETETLLKSLEKPKALYEWTEDGKLFYSEKDLLVHIKSYCLGSKKPLNLSDEFILSESYVLGEYDTL